MKTNEMYALTLYQPYAMLCVLAQKEWETRSWLTHYRGELIIHASAKFPKEAQNFMRTNPYCREALSFYHFDFVEQMPLGCFVGKVNVTACLETNTLDRSILPREIAFGDYSPGRFMWGLSNPLHFKKYIDAKGNRRLWKVPNELRDLVREQIGR